MDTKLKVVAYCRVSTENDDQTNSLKSQCSYFSDYITKNKDWVLVEIFADEGLSGTSTKKRKEFNRMISMARNKEIDLILTKEVSRFARNTVDTLNYTRELKGMGVGVLFINDNINTLDNDGELRLTIMSSIAQEESRKTSERVKWGQTRRMEQGVVFGNGIYGYNLENGVLSINIDEARIVREIFTKFLNEGKGTQTIARELTLAGIKPKRTREWSSTAVLKFLRNEKYCGDLLQKKSYTPSYLEHKKVTNKNIEEKVLIENHHEAIVSKDMWLKTQEELLRRSPSEEVRTKHSNRYWCSGKLICGECGRRFVSKTSKSVNGYPYKGWRCINGARHGTLKKDAYGVDVGCNSKAINEKVLKYCCEYVIKNIQQNKDEILNEMINEIKSIQSNSIQIDTSVLLKEIEGIRLKKEKAIDSMLEGTISKEDLCRMNERYNNEIEVLQNQVDKSDNINLIQKNQIENIEVYISKIKDMLDFKCDSELILKQMMDKLVVYNEKIVVVNLNCIPFGYKLKYSTTGRKDNFQVYIDETTVVV